jgi:hypothetical protein
MECLKHADFHVEPLGRGSASLDTGIHDSLLEVDNFIEAGVSPALLPGLLLEIEAELELRFLPPVRIRQIGGQKGKQTRSSGAGGRTWVPLSLIVTGVD